MALVECVPNFSEGRRVEVLEAILDAARAVDGVRVLDSGMDADHNRAVATLAAPPDAAVEAGVAAIAAAAQRIDLTTHAGVHPRMGATDVWPFVPLADIDLAACADLAHRLGERVGSELGIPVYYYGAAASRPDREALPNVRRGGFEALRDAVGRDADRVPDAGPTDAVHPTAGATAVGARPFLIAYNVNLETDDAEVARDIAREVRESSGGLPGIRALGLFLAERGIAQVSMNVCDHQRTGLERVFEEVRARAADRGVDVRESELIGLAPRAALNSGIARRIRLADFDPHCIVEERLG